MHGVELEGHVIEITEQDDRALLAWELLTDVGGSIDMQSIPWVMAYTGETDPQALIDRLLVIKRYYRRQT